MNFNLKLAILRSPHRTQIRLAAVTGIDEARLSRIVHEWILPTADEKRAIAKAVGAPIRALFPAMQAIELEPEQPVS